MNKVLSIAQESPMGGSMMNFDFLFIFVIIGMFVTMLINIFIAYLVYKDANNKGNVNAGLWFIIVLFTSLFGVILYLVLSSPQQKTAPIPNTSNQTSDASPKYYKMSKNFCNSCGTELETDSKFCQSCGSEI